VLISLLLFITGDAHIQEAKQRVGGPVSPVISSCESSYI